MSHGLRKNRAGVVVASTSAAAGLAEDLTGPVLVDWLREHGFEVGEPLVVPDAPPWAPLSARSCRWDPPS